MIHVSDINHTQQCPRLAWKLNRHLMPAEPFANSIYSFSGLYLPYLGASNWPSGQAYDSSQDTLAILKEHKKGIQLRFEKEGLRGRIPLLVQKEDGSWKAIYPLRSVYPKEKELDTMLWNKWLAEDAGLQITEHEIVWINSQFVEGGQEPLLLKGRHLMKKRGQFFEKNIDEMLAEKDVCFEELLQQAKLAVEQEIPQPAKCKACSAPRRCSFYEECFDTASLSDDSILHLCSSAQRQKIFEDGILYLKDMPPFKMEGLPLQYAQVQAAQNPSGRFVDRKGLQGFMKDLQYPLIYLDFEWDTFLFPPYPRMKPFDVLCFQFSMHVEQEDGSLSHFSFFAEGDCRKAFLEALFADLPKQGTILVYNMEGAEKLRLQQLGAQFPEFQVQIEQAVSRMKDLSLPFEQGLFYDLSQRGKSSLKSILPLFTGEDPYKNLEVGNGLDAIYAYRKACASQDPQVKEELAQAISDYCAMDTLAEYDVLHGLQNILAGKE